MEQIKINDITFILGDCNEFLKEQKENAFDLAIVDPPYGLGKRTTEGGSKKNTQTKFNKELSIKNWDSKTPDIKYFNYLKYASKNYIVFGGNYFPLSEYRTFIVWDKMTFIPSMSRVELAVTSFDSPATYVKINSNQSGRIHPTQKPVKLYEWILLNYANEGESILDTHGGSGSLAIACYNLGFKLTIIEKDEEYFYNMIERFKKVTSQLRIF